MENNNTIDMQPQKFEIYPDQVSEVNGVYAEGGYNLSELENVLIGVTDAVNKQANEKLKHIVIACNNHDKLIEALKAIVKKGENIYTRTGWMPEYKEAVRLLQSIEKETL